MSRKAEFYALIEPLLKGKKEVKQDTIELAQELQDVLNGINIDVNGESFGDLKEAFNEKLTELGKQPIVFSENTLKGVIDQFANAVSAGIKAGVAASGNEMESLLDEIWDTKLALLKDKAALEEAYNERRANGRGSKTKVKVPFSKAVNAAWSNNYQPADTTQGIGVRLGALKKSYSKATNWEDQYIVLLKYIKEYEALEKLVDKNHDIGKFNKWNLIGGYGIDDLKRQRADIESSLQNIFNLANNKPLIGLTPDGAIDIGVELKPIKMLDTYDVTGGKGEIEVPVKPKIEEYKVYRAIEYNSKKLKTKTEAIDDWGAEYWATDKSAAQSYTGNHYGESSILIGTIKPTNPLIIDVEGLQWDAFDEIPEIKELFPGISDVMKQKGYYSDLGQKYINEQARLAGFDAVIFKNVQDNFDADLNGDAPISDTIAVLDDRIISLNGAFAELEGQVDESGNKLFSKSKDAVPDFYEQPIELTPEQHLSALQKQQDDYDKWYQATISRLSNDKADAGVIQMLQKQHDRAVKNFETEIEYYQRVTGGDATGSTKEKTDVRRKELTQQLDEYSGDVLDSKTADENLAKRKEIFELLKQEGLLTDEIKKNYDEVNQRLKARADLIREAEDFYDDSDDVITGQRVTSVDSADQFRKDHIQPFDNVIDKMRTSGAFSEEEIEKNFIAISNAMERRARDIAAKDVFAELDNKIVDPNTINDVKQLNSLLQERNTILNRVDEMSLIDYDHNAYADTLKHNQLIEDRIALLQKENNIEKKDGVPDGASSAEVDNLRQQLYEARKAAMDAGAWTENERNKRIVAEEALSDMSDRLYDAEKQAHAAEEEAAKLRDELSKKHAGASGGTGDADTGAEASRMTGLKEAVEAVTEAVGLKTSAFQTEKTEVDKVVDAEIESLGRLESKITTIKGIFEGLVNNIRGGSDDIGAGLNNVNINVNYPENSQTTLDQDALNRLAEVIRGAQIKTPETALDVAGKALATEGTLSAIKTAVESINSKTIKGTKVGSGSDRKSTTKSDYQGSPFFGEKLKTREMELAKFTQQLMNDGQDTTKMQDAVKQLRDALKLVNSGEKLSVWDQKFRQAKLAVGIDELKEKPNEQESVQTYKNLIAYAKEYYSIVEKYEKAKDNSRRKAILAQQKQDAETFMRDGGLNFDTLELGDEAYNKKLSDLRAKHKRNLEIIRADKTDNTNAQRVKEELKIVEKYAKEMGELEAELRFAGTKETEEINRQIAKKKEYIDLKKQELQLDENDLLILKTKAYQDKSNALALKDSSAQDKADDAAATKRNNEAYERLIQLRRTQYDLEKKLSGEKAGSKLEGTYQSQLNAIKHLITNQKTLVHYNAKYEKQLADMAEAHKRNKEQWESGKIDDARAEALAVEKKEVKELADAYSELGKLIAARNYATTPEAKNAIQETINKRVADIRGNSRNTAANRGDFISALRSSQETTEDSLRQKRAEQDGKKRIQDEANALRVLIDLEKEHGALEAKREFASTDVEKNELDRQITKKKEEIELKKKGIQVDEEELRIARELAKQRQHNTLALQSSRAQGKADKTTKEQENNKAYERLIKLKELQYSIEKKLIAAEAGSQKESTYKDQLAEVEALVEAQKQLLYYTDAVYEQKLKDKEDTQRRDIEELVSGMADQENAKAKKEADDIIKEKTKNAISIAKDIGELEAQLDFAESDKEINELIRQIDELTQKLQALKQELNLNGADVDSAIQGAYTDKHNSLAISDSRAQGRKEERDALNTEKQTVKELNDLYKKLGQAEAKRDMISSDVGAAIIADAEAEEIREEIQEKRKLIKVNNELENQFADSWMSGIEQETQKPIKDLRKEYEKLGELRALVDKTPNGDYLDFLKRQLSAQEKLVKVTSKRLELDEALKFSYEQASNAAYAKKINDIEKRAAKERDKKHNKEQDELLRKQIQQSKELAKISKAKSAIDKADNVVASATSIGGWSNEQIAILNEYSAKLKDLKDKYTEIKYSDGAVTEEQQKEIITQTTNVNALTKEIGELIAEYNRLSGDNVTELGANTLSDNASIQDKKQKLTELAMAYSNGKAVIKKYDATTGELTAEIQSGKYEVTEYTFALRQLGNQFVAVQGATKKLESPMEKLKRKMSEILTYFGGSSLIYEFFGQFRQGVQYVRDIDLALTELKKVTDETEESYDRFLETAAKTADKVGSTITNIVSSTADWARLGFSMEEAAQLAESTSVLLNVSEFSSIEDATSALTSTMQAFGYVAEDSMHVVDVLNEVGKLVARR